MMVTGSLLFGMHKNALMDRNFGEVLSQNVRPLWHGWVTT